MNDLKKQDYKLMVRDIKEYIEREINKVCSGESERILEDIKEIIESWESE